MGACHEDDQPILPVHGGDSCPPGAGRRRRSRRDREQDEACACADCGIMLAIILLLGVIFLYGSEDSKPLEYSVAITGVSGLDPVTDLQQGRGLLNPEFNLTIGITSRSASKGGCIQPRTSIKVSYSDLRVRLAGGRAPEMCVGPRQSIEPHQVVAGGHDVALPGFLVDSLAEDIRRGDAIFEVRLMVLGSAQQWNTVTCWAKLGDATGAALKIPCKESSWWPGAIEGIPEDSSYVPRPVPAAGPN